MRVPAAKPTGLPAGFEPPGEVYLAMAAAQERAERPMQMKPETDDEYYKRVHKEWDMMSTQTLRSIAREDQERNVQDLPPSSRSKEYFQLWKEERLFHEKSFELSPTELKERYGSGKPKRPR